MVVHRALFRLLGLVGLIVVCGSVPAAAQAGTVSFNPEISYVAPGQVFNVDLQVDASVLGAHCYMVTVDFDRTLLEIVSAYEGPWLQTYGGTFFFWEDTEEGCDLGICLLGNGLYGDGPGEMATITFRALSLTGDTPLEFLAVDFTDIDLEPITVTSSDGSVQIGTGTCCQDRVGDANMNGEDEPTIGDVSTMIDAKFITGTCDGIIECLAEADINQSGGPSPTCADITIGDISELVDYLYITGKSLGLRDCF